MNPYSIKHELQTILSGKSGNSQDPIVQAIASYLGRSQRASPMAEEKHENKSKETARLRAYAVKNDLFYNDIDEEKYISQGAEQKVYVKNGEFVIKLNDAVYYASDMIIF